MQRGGGAQKLDTMITHLRLLLADVAARDDQLATLCRQLREQSERVVTFSLYGDADLGRSLSLLGDIEQRLVAAETERRHLQRIRERAERELESLLLTKGVEQAKARLASLYERRLQIQAALDQLTAPGTPHVDLDRAGQLERAASALDQEIRQLQQEINEASERAARSVEGQRR